MNVKSFFKDVVGWGVGLWLFGYILGFVFFALVPPATIGWVIMPFGIVATLWVLLKKIKSDSVRYYFLLGTVWAVVAIILDYFFLVKLLKPADGYYKLDVYLYYILTFALPVVVGKFKNK